MVPFNVGIESAMFRITRSIRSLRALIANKRLLDTVLLLHVAFKMNISMENLPANFTLDVQLIFVRFEVWFDLMFREELFPALWTVIIPPLLVISQYVIFQTHSVNIALSIRSIGTSIANIRSLDNMDLIHMALVRWP